MSKTQVIIALVVLCLVGTIWGSIQDKKSTSLERQLAVYKKQASAAAPAVDPSAAKEAQAAVKAAQDEADKLKSQNKKLLANVATLKGGLATQQKELTDLKKAMTEAAGGSQALQTMRAQLDECSAEKAKQDAAIVAVKAELTAAEEAAAGLEEVKSTLANTVDTYSAKSQELSAEVEKSAQRIQSLEADLEEQTKLLAANEEELGRTKLNMNVLLSKIAAQNKSLAILEETRIALEKELAVKFQTIEDLQQQLSAQVGVEVVVEEGNGAGAAAVEEAQAE